MNRAAALIALLSVGSAWATTDAPEILPEGEMNHWRFQVFLDDKLIGHHDFRVLRQGERKRVFSDANFEVRFLFVTAYRYEHRNQEIWSKGCLEALNAATNDNGDRSQLRGDAADGQFDVSLNDERTTLAETCVRSFAYWDAELLDTEALLNAQTGDLKPIRLERLGPATITVEGQDLASEALQLVTEDAVIDLWYERDTGRWLGLETSARGDRRLRYVPEQLPELPMAATRVAQDPREQDPRPLTAE